VKWGDKRKIPLRGMVMEVEEKLVRLNSWIRIQNKETQTYYYNEEIVKLNRWQK